MDRRREARRLGYEIRRSFLDSVDRGILLFLFVFWLLTELALFGLTVGTLAVGNVGDAWLFGTVFVVLLVPAAFFVWLEL